MNEILNEVLEQLKTMSNRDLLALIREITFILEAREDELPQSQTELLIDEHKTQGKTQ